MGVTGCNGCNRYSSNDPFASIDYRVNVPFMTYAALSKRSVAKIQLFMTKRLPDDLREAIVKNLKDLLEVVEVRSNQFLDTAKFWDLGELDKKLIAKESLKPLSSSVGEEPLRVFFSETISEDLMETRDFEGSKPNFPLKELDTYSDTAAVSERLVADFESLPFIYKALIELPFLMRSGLERLMVAGELKITDTIKIVKADESYSAKFPAIKTKQKVTSVNFWGWGKSREIMVGSTEGFLYLECDITGFVGYWTDTEPIINLDLDLRTFFGLAYAVDLFRAKYFIPSLSDKETLLRVYEYKDQGYKSKRVREMRQGTVRGIGRFEISEWVVSAPLLKASEGVAKGGFAAIARLFERRTEPSVQKVLRASQWLFDSTSEENDILAYVQAMVCVEILLGEKAETNYLSLGKLLKNRCAYLIGKTDKDRQSIMRRFDDLYDTRSRIVHSGHNKLSKAERDDLYELRHLCRRIIQAEVMILS